MLNTGKAQLVCTLDDDRVHVERVEKELAAAANDSMRASAHLRLSFLYRLVSDTANAGVNLRRGLVMSRNYPFLKAVSSYYEVLGLFATGNVSLIEQKLRHTGSLPQPFNTKPAARFRAMVWQNPGTLEQLKGNEKGAMDCIVNKAIVFAEKSENPIVRGGTHKGAGLIFLMQRNGARRWIT